MFFGFEHLTVGYSRTAPILHDLTLALAEGEFVALVGPNGCGKSTLLKTVHGTLRPWSGEVIYRGTPLRKRPPREIARQIAYLPQHHSAPGALPLRTLVGYGRYPHGGNAARDDAIIADALARTGLTDLADRPLAALSGGEQQRAWLAMALCQQPALLLLDEPTTYLDIGHQLALLECVSALQTERRLTVLAVLHDLNLAARFADRLCVMQNGAIVADGPPQALLTPALLREIFGVDAAVDVDCDGHPYFIPRRQEDRA